MSEDALGEGRGDIFRPLGRDLFHILWYIKYPLPVTVAGRALLF